MSVCGAMKVETMKDTTALRKYGGMAVAAILPGLSACASTFVGAGPGWDAGTLGVSGVDTGIGVHLEAVGYAGEEATGLGLGPAVQLAGYDTDGDADPIAFTTLEARYRRRFGTPRRAGPYWELGSGAGVAWAPGVQRAAVPFQGEIGVQTLAGRALLSLGVRERFLLLIGTGSPPFDAFNSVQLIGRIGWGRDDRR